MVFAVSISTVLAETPITQPFDTIGGIVTFGRYEQDANEENGPEEIEWIVLDVQDRKALLLSRYGLEAKPYNTENTDVTWEICTLRTWLNSDFRNKAFSAEEQSAILTTTVDNSSSQGHNDLISIDGNNTQDKIFLLSYAEANRYLGVKYWKEATVITQNHALRLQITPSKPAQIALTFTRRQTACRQGGGGSGRPPTVSASPRAWTATARSTAAMSTTAAVLSVRPFGWI